MTRPTYAYLRSTCARASDVSWRTTSRPTRLFATRFLTQSRPLAEQTPAPAAAASTDRFNDSHLHLTNYIQEGTGVRKYVDIMGARVGRSTLFGIPLQQTWDYGNTGDFAPTYYLQTDAPLYYSSFTDAFIAMAYRSRRSRAPIRSRIRWHS